MKSLDPDSPGGRLRAARKARRLTVDRLAADLGYSRTHLTHMELNRHRGGRHAWQVIATYFALPLDHFIGQTPVAAERQAPIAGQPLPDSSAEDDRFAELAGQVEEMLHVERAAADARTVAKLTRKIWREAHLYAPPMPTEDALALVTEQERDKIRRLRAAIFLKDA